MKNRFGRFMTAHTTIAYNRMGDRKREALRERRLQALVAYAVAHSPLYRELYGAAGLLGALEGAARAGKGGGARGAGAGMGASPAVGAAGAGVGAGARRGYWAGGLDAGGGVPLSALPPVNKAAMMRRFDEWVTDPAITLEGVLAFMHDRANLGRPFLDGYLAFKTSGSTGEPSVVIHDESSWQVIGATFLYRGFSHKGDMARVVMAGGRIASLYSDMGVNIGNASAHKGMQDPKSGKKVLLLDIFRPMEETVAKLNAFQPNILGGYCSALGLAAEEQLAGRLHVSPVLVTGNGEQMDPDTRGLIERAFRCHVQSDYGCTETSMISCDCLEKRYHISDDWYLMEPVDRDYRPVPLGQVADKWLLTSLANYTQPFIRYEITDRVVLRDEPCRCGNRSPWVTVEGRTDDVLTFEGEGGAPVRIHPFALTTLLKAVEAGGVRRFQVVQHERNVLELRLAAGDRAAAFAEAEARVTAFLASRGVCCRAFLSDEEPHADPRTGKFTRVAGLRGTGRMTFGEGGALRAG